MAQLTDQEKEHSQGSSERSMHVSLMSFNSRERVTETEVEEEKETDKNSKVVPLTSSSEVETNTEIEENMITEPSTTDTTEQPLNEDEIRERLRIFTQSLQESNSVAGSDNINSPNSPQQNIRSSKNPRKAHYKKYTDEQITNFINLVIEGMSVKSAAAKSDITPNSAYRFRKMWNEAGVTPTRHKRGPAEGSMSKLKDEHTKFIVDYVDREMGGGSLAQIKDALMKEFHGLSVSSSALHRHMKTKCAFSLKRIHKTPEARQDSDFVAFFEQWIASKDIDFESNCVFVSEANFMRVDRSSGWLSKGIESSSNTAATAKQEASTSTDSSSEASRQKTQKRASGVMVTVLGAISYRGVIDVSLRRAAHGDTATIAATRLGKRRVDGTPINSSEDDHKHFLTYLTDLMNVLDRHGWQGYYLILDDTNIRDPALVKRKIEERGYRCAFLPTVMPVPNPMEKLWNKMQIGIDRRPLDGDLSQRIIDSCSEITPDDCHDWIRIALPCSPRSITSGRTSCFK